MTNKPRAIPIVGTVLLFALTGLALPSQASGELTAEVTFDSHNNWSVVPPAGWSCNVQPIVQTGNALVVELDCVDLTLGVPLCGTVTAGVKDQTGTLGHTAAVAACANSRAECDATHAEPPVGPVVDVPCEAIVSGTGPAVCYFVTTVNVNYNRTGYCKYA